MNNNLTHHGILGMKWGVRRTQTQLGRSRKPSEARSNGESKNNIKSMTDDELRKVVNRLQMERQYSQLSTDSVGKGKQYVQKVIKAGTTVAAITTTSIKIYNNVKKIKSILAK